jgi:hypothetical protein
MATGYFLCTDESEVFHTFFLTDGEVLTTGQPVTNSYNSEGAMAQAIGTYTGNPNYYYEDLVIPPFYGPEQPSLGEEPSTPLITVNTTYGPTFAQAWTVNGEDVDYLQGREIQIQEGPFLITGIVSIIESYAFNETQTYFNLVSPNSFQPYINYQSDGFTGAITSISENASEYGFFSGITTTVPISPSTQGFQMQGDLRDYNAYRVYYYDQQVPQSEVFLGVISYNEGSGTSLCQLISGGSEIPYATTGNFVSFILTNDAELVLPPSVSRPQGNGRTAYQNPTQTTQYFDLFEDLATIPGFNASTTQIYILKNGIEIVGTANDVFYWAEDPTPYTRIFVQISGVPVPFVDQGTPITWYFDPST